MNKPLTIILTSLLMSTFAAWAANDQVTPKNVPAADAAAAAQTDGEVRKVDMEAKKLTLKHAEIKNLGMPGMTMVFQVKDPAMLKKVKPGDKVRFTAERINGAFTVTTLEAAK
ncbi:copper-binding protein [Sphaerotilaceae bacterium SBD11-9]